MEMRKGNGMGPPPTARTTTGPACPANRDESGEINLHLKHDQPRPPSAGRRHVSCVWMTMMMLLLPCEDYRSTRDELTTAVSECRYR
ncbi:hypothetical protein ZHAS_00021286 [Anopheles sinensis]|uniref:Uncharacterized protein n=1 Tax=Anopheles sinensis TaxID=74873 RepID=A0A084WS00_ANOSI|nr:hypothetical protein ZHAS_00021286 [Anopheles sinensis]